MRTVQAMRIFVSGTSGDLARFRKAVAEQLGRLGVEAVEQTYFGVDYRELPTLLRDKIKSCDAVICLVGSAFGASPPGSSRSYTQMEYGFALEYSKPLFLFFPSANAELDSGAQDTPEQRQLQEAYVQDLRSTTHLRYEFRDETHLRLVTAEAFFTISPETARSKLASSVTTRFPTPLALLYDDCIASKELDSLEALAAELLRFITLLALHDSVVHRIFGRQSVDAGERIRALCDPARLRDWHSLLRLSCPDEGTRVSHRFVAEFGGWEIRNSKTLANLVEIEAASPQQRRRSNRQHLSASVREGIASVFSDLDFLTRYVLLAITRVDPLTGRCETQVLRGLAPRAFDVVADPQSKTLLLENQLYLLDVDRRRALWMAPPFAFESAEGGGRVYGWAGLSANPDNSLEVRLAPFDEHEEVAAGERPDTRATLSDWLGDELCSQAFGFQVPAGPIEREGKLLDDDSWERLQKLVLPDSGDSSVLGGRFRLESVPIHRGLHTDVFAATDIAAQQPENHMEVTAPAVPANPVAHVLRADGVADEQVRLWFAHRSACWRRMTHPAVLPLHEVGDPAGNRGLPYLLTDRVTNARSLERMVQSGEPLSDAIVARAIELAAGVCHLAHRQGIFLLALPARHFLVDDGNNLFMTGFEAAACAERGEAFPPCLLKHLNRFSKDVLLMAPEIRREMGEFAPTLDVFAIGALLARLRGWEAQPMEELTLRAWADPWKCLAFHCLAVDPNLRFQSAAQVSVFLREWLRRTEPQTVALPAGGSGRCVSIGKYPVTNCEYRRFCQDRDYPLPSHLCHGRQQQEEGDASWRRSAGPWLPVTNVSMLDAEAYCQWLSNLTGKLWRLPRESEWLWAAGRQGDSLYPWGNETPDRNRANFAGYFRGPTVVGAFPAGGASAGCLDMAGNVWEWCTDFVRSGAPRRILKGGAHGHSAETLRLAGGSAAVVACRSPHIGFRVLCEEKR